MKVIIHPSTPPTPEERAHNRALLERYIPEFIPVFVNLHKLGGKMGTIEIEFPDSDKDFIMSMMDSTKELVK